MRAPSDREYLPDEQRLELAANGCDPGSRRRHRPSRHVNRRNEPQTAVGGRARVAAVHDAAAAFLSLDMGFRDQGFRHSRENGGTTTGSPRLPPQQNGTAHPTEGIAMDAVKTWTVQVDIDEHEDRTRAVARLRTDGSQSLAGTGLARLNPADRNVPQIGDELAVARALSELSHLLLDVAARDIEQTSGVPAHPAL
jgi:hypothetical protein